MNPPNDIRTAVDVGANVRGELLGVDEVVTGAAGAAGDTGAAGAAGSTGVSTTGATIAGAILAGATIAGGLLPASSGLTVGHTTLMVAHENVPPIQVQVVVLTQFPEGQQTWSYEHTTNSTSQSSPEFCVTSGHDDLSMPLIGDGVLRDEGCGPPGVGVVGTITGVGTPITDGEHSFPTHGVGDGVGLGVAGIGHVSSRQIYVFENISHQQLRSGL